jgi:hypothetical protein
MSRRHVPRDQLQRDDDRVDRHDDPPSAGPKSSAAVIVKLSEMEKLAGTLGRRSVARPLRTVRLASASHGRPTEPSATSRVAEAMTSAPPQTIADR